ncbi:pro-adrenomedullin isoform X2 [Desmodus rotundus]|uniref:pro-adrenomedullin isoform X2 n=1 Tax=Desmodus rotundus TaxID=9430 RepID=UPI002380CC9E|nr:pro-adrenomedullin isoform X2 [Desmodus rotundus]
MKLAPVALLYLGSLAFLGADAAPLDVASELGDIRAQSREKRELEVSSSYGPGVDSAQAGPPPAVTQPQPAHTVSQHQDSKRDSRSIQDSPDAVRSRVKRHRQRGNKFRALRSPGCNFPTCSVHGLAHRLHTYNDSSKDPTAPKDKIGPEGYGRRRRRSLPEAGRAGTS